jgi:signal transduction histidine kinase/ActR/RegA family two-component response regulator
VVVLEGIAVVSQSGPTQRNRAAAEEGRLALTVLHYARNQGDAALVRTALQRSSQATFEWVQVYRLREALTEAMAGSVDAVLIDMACKGDGERDALDCLAAVSGAAIVVYTQAETTDSDWILRGADDALLYRYLPSTLLPTVLMHAVLRHRVRSELVASEARLRAQIESTRRHQALEQRQVEQRLVTADRLASLGLLAAGVAHEVNNPLTYVQLNLGWLLEQINNLQDRIEPDLIAEMRLTLKENQEGVEHIRSIVRDLSSFAKAGGDEVQELDLADVVRSACNLVRNELRHRAELVLDLQPCPIILGQRSRLTQLVVNLLVNAANALEEGAAHENTVTIRCGATDDGLGLVVEDTGCGIPASTLENIFEAFYTTRDSGTGLGLSLCAKTAQHHGGTLRVSSTVGRGSRFTLLLPLETGLKLNVSSRPQFPVQANAPMRILVVDDEERVGSALVRAMSPKHEIVVTTDGGEALRLLSHDSNFDAILCDVMMPVDGLRLYAALAKEHPNLTERVVFLTGEAFTARARSFLKDVPNQVLSKPVQLDVIIDALVQAAGWGESTGR